MRPAAAQQDKQHLYNHLMLKNATGCGELRYVSAELWLAGSDQSGITLARCFTSH